MSLHAKYSAAGIEHDKTDSKLAKEHEQHYAKLKAAKKLPKAFVTVNEPPVEPNTRMFVNKKTGVPSFCVLPDENGALTKIVTDQDQKVYRLKERRLRLKKLEKN